MTVDVVSPELRELIVAISYKVVDERIQEYATTRQDLAEVKAVLHDLAAAQARTEVRVEELAAAQARTEARVEELAAAQARTEARVEELAAAQARTEARVEELAAAQARTEERLQRLEATVEQLIAAQARTEERLQRLEATVEQLIAAQARTEERLQRLEAAVEQLIAAQARTEERLQRLEAIVERLAEAQVRTEETIARMQDTLAELQGRQLEHDYRDKAYAYFGLLLRRVRVVPLQELEEELLGRLSQEELAALIPLDLLVRGRPRQKPEAPEVWLAIEVSATVDRNDVLRAQKRASILRRAGYRAIPVAAGKQITLGAEKVARAGKVLLLQDSQVRFWDEALAELLAEEPSLLSA